MRLKHTTFLVIHRACWNNWRFFATQSCRIDSLTRRLATWFVRCMLTASDGYSLPPLVIQTGVVCFVARSLPVTPLAKLSPCRMLNKNSSNELRIRHAFLYIGATPGPFFMRLYPLILMTRRIMIAFFSKPPLSGGRGWGEGGARMGAGG